MAITITYPTEYELQMVLFVQDESEATVTKQEGYCRIDYSHWVLPNSGICWKLVEKGAAATASPQLKA